MSPSGFLREVDMEKDIEDFPNGAMVPVPRYSGTMSWEYPGVWDSESGQGADA